MTIHVLCAACLAALWAMPVAAGEQDERIEFNRDIRPILSDNCFKCHGPDSAKRVTKLRLDDPGSATSDLGGYRAVTPGKPAESEVVRRITTSDPDDHMPPSDSGLRLTPAQVEVIRLWIEQGAPWQKHWAFIPPARVAVPGVQEAAWARNPIDNFVLERLEREGLGPAAEAPKEVLIRRLTLDLTGLPPAVEEVDAFLADDAPGAYEKVVDRLFASPRRGEHLALEWLDAARYADTNGYQGDSTRTLWAWRDWVVSALNANMPFDQFTVEQLAGDLLPGATQDQRIATGFNRNHMLNGEGGRIAEESRAEYVMDRVETTATVWLGMTLTCARCHDHKYDAVSQKEYYGFYAYFNNLPESGGVDAGGNANPILRIKTPATGRELDQLRGEIDQARARLLAASPEIDAAEAEWERSQPGGEVSLTPWTSVGPFQAKDFDAAFAGEFGPEKEGDPAAAFEDGKQRWTARDEWTDGKVQPLSGSNAATYLQRKVVADRATTATLSLGSDDGIKVWVNGRQVHANKLIRGAAPDQDRVTVALEAGENRLLMKVVNATGGYGFYFNLLHVGPPPEIKAILATPEEGRSAGERERLREHFRSSVSPRLKDVAGELTALRARIADIESSLPVTMVMEEMSKPRETYVLIRGAYDKPGEKTASGIPAALPPLPPGAPASRLGLARWLADRSNPLTARVTVNRQWALFFGTGIVKTVEDFGSQGDPPSHPELLDWLAAAFAGGWDLKALQRLFVTSAVYRQSSAAGPELLERDPANRLLARAPRQRLTSYALRDQALALAGLLVERMGGPPVKPYQPPGVWEDFSFGQISYQQDRGESLYRRSLYAFWRRSVGPTMLFDASARQVCTVRQARTNTPLHALVLLNDVTYVEAARGLAQQMLRRDMETDEARLAWAFRAATARRPRPEELAVLVRSLERARGEFQAAPEAAIRLLSAGESPREAGLDPVELAAHAAVASVILNLDETISRE